jgi:hypothetical protein
MHWCEQIIRQFHPATPVAAEFIQQGRHIIPDWYRKLVSLARAQVISVHPPLLDLAPQPFADGKELARVDLLQELGFTTQDSEL